MRLSVCDCFRFVAIAPGYTERADDRYENLRCLGWQARVTRPVSSEKGSRDELEERSGERQRPYGRGGRRC